ncbi:DNA polymerase III subunit beta [Xanthobacter sp. TB0136]|uniref:DNA polymerase III subunit beta n=1 Tax=Xanthobacter sp. TB0136 TaxID=3459177 RepID=UPI00403A738A
MKLTLEKDALTHALARAERVVEKRNSIPILGNLLIRAQGDHLFVTGTDLDSAITTRAQAEVAQPGETTLPAGTLIDFAKKLPTGQKVTLEQTGDDPRIALRAGRTRLHLPTIPPADFPTFTGAEPLASFELPASQMVAAIERVAFAISTEETRYYLNGIYFHIAEGEKGSRLTAVATDGHRLGLHALTIPEGAASLPVRA